ncbi:TonB-dependent receptor [Haematobacter genomosp. 1]|nr:TonB-dependent receptor [Haematobacter genomosp. 1]
MSIFSTNPRRLMLALLSLSTCPAGLLHAQETTLDTVVITGPPTLGFTTPATSGSRLGVSVKDIPASISVVTAVTIAARGQTDVVEAVTQDVPGVTSVAAPVFGSAYALRGFQGNNSVMQLYDGTRLFPGRGNISFPFDSWLVERIEVLHGPASVMHGTGAIGGTIDIQPKRPFAGPIRQEVAALLDSNLRTRLAYDAGGSLNDRLSFRLNAVGDASQGWVDDTDSRNLVLSGALAWEATDEVKVTLSGAHADREPPAYFGTPLRDGTIVESFRDNNFNVSDAENRFRDSWMQLRTEWTPSDTVGVEWVIYGIDSRRIFRNAETYLWDPATDLVTVDEFRRIRQDQSQFGTRANVRFSGDVAGRSNQLLLGFDVNRAKSDFADFAAYAPRFVDPWHPEVGRFPLPDDLVPRYHSTLNQHAVFAEDRLEITDRWAISAGLRYDWFTVEREDHISAANDFSADFEGPGGRLGLTFAPNTATVFYVQMSYATDPVNLPLLDYSASMTDFDMTTGRQFELGVKQSVFEGRGEWSLAVFDIIKRNLLVFDSATFATQQVGRQSSRGVELAGAFQLSDDVKLGGNAAWTRARYDDFTSINWLTFEVEDYSGNVPILVPELSGNLWGSWDFAPGWRANGSVQLIGKSYYDFANTTKRAGYGLVNVGVDYVPDAASVWSLRVTNLLDRVYADYLRTDPSTERAQAFLGQPRTVELAYRRKF